MKPSSPTLRRVVAGFALLLLILALSLPLWSGRAVEAPARMLGGWIARSDSLVPADAIYVLNGRISVRASNAAALFHAGLAPTIIIPQTSRSANSRRRPAPTVAEAIAARLEQLDVPASAIQIIPGEVSSTADEARALRNFVQEKNWKRVIVATTDHHTGRAGWLIRRELRGEGVQILMAGGVNHQEVSPDDWWKSDVGRRLYLTEMLKWVGSVFVRP